MSTATVDKTKYEVQLALPLKADIKTVSSYAMEPKYDGARLLVVKRGSTVSCETRTGNDHSHKFDHIIAALKDIPGDFALDGEVVDIKDVVSIAGKDVPVSRWAGVQSVLSSNGKKNALSFVVFDCLMTDGKDIRTLPDVIRRKKAAEVVKASKGKSVLLTARWDAYDADIYQQMIDAGVEGAILKNQFAPYRSGRRPVQTWVKLKPFSTADVVIMGYKPGEGSFKGLVGAVEFGQYKKGKLVARSRCSGMDFAFRKELTDNGQKYLGRVMEIRYMGLTDDGNFRHPVFSRLRDDKTSEMCEWDS